MAKCRLLYQENEELGRMIASGRIAKLEGDLALQRSFSEEMKKSQSGIAFIIYLSLYLALICGLKQLLTFSNVFITELDEFLQDLDEDVEGMQSTIYFLQQELRKARESVTLLQQENAGLKANSSENNLTNGLSPHTPPIKKEDSEENSISEIKTSKSMEDSDVCKGARTPPLSSQRSPQCEFSNTERTERVERKPSQADHNDESSSDSAALIIKVENEELSDREEEHEESRNNKRILRSKSHNRNNNKTNGEEVLTRITRGRDRTKRDKSAPGSDDERTYKKKRRESMLSLDYNEADDDALVLTNGETLQSDPE